MTGLEWHTNLTLRAIFMKHLYILTSLFLIAPFAMAEEPIRERIE
jgi:hypothetical protein